MTNSDNNLVPVFSRDSNPYGLSYADWTAKWWQWLLSIPLKNNPINDSTGKNCAINQSGPVWFLAGTIGGAGRDMMPERNCIIPAGKAVLFPILNYGATFADEPTIKSEQELVSLANREMDIVSTLEVTVDGVKLNGLEKYRVQSPIFQVVLPENNLFDGTPGPTKGAADGYWLFLKPLDSGKHEIHSFGSCLAGKVNIGVNYHITIVE